MTAGIFVAVDSRHRERLPPELRNVLEGLRMNFIEHIGVDADIGDADTAAMYPARQQQMRRLAPEKRDGLNGLDRDSFKLGTVGAEMDHSTRFVLVDRKGQIRGYYGIATGDPVPQLAEDARRVMKEL